MVAFGVHDDAEHRDEVRRRAVLVDELGVDGPDDRRRVVGVGRAGRDHRAREHRPPRRVHPLPDRVADDDDRRAVAARRHLVEVARHAGLRRDVAARDVDQRQPRRLARSEHVLERADPLELGLAAPAADRRARRPRTPSAPAARRATAVIDASHVPSTCSLTPIATSATPVTTNAQRRPNHSGRAEDRHELQRPVIAVAREPQRRAGHQRGGDGGDPQIALFVGKHGARA